MKTNYYLLINKCFKFIYLIIFFTLMHGCYPGWIVPSRPDVFIKESFDQTLHNGHLGIFPFEYTEPRPELGLQVANIFKQEISKKKFFKQITVVEDSEWLDQRDYDALKINRAVVESVEKKFDAILLGSVEEFITGNASETRITINAMLIDVPSGKNLWWGKCTTAGMPGKSFLFFGSSPSPATPSIKKLIHKTVKKIVSSIL